MSSSLQEPWFYHRKAKLQSREPEPLPETQGEKGLVQLTLQAGNNCPSSRCVKVTGYSLLINYS